RKHRIIHEARRRFGLIDAEYHCKKESNEVVRLQMAYSLSNPEAPKEYGHAKALAQLLCKDAENRYILAAGLSSISDKNWTSLLAELVKQPEIPPQLFGPIMKLASVDGNSLDVSRLFVRQLNAEQAPMTAKQLEHAGLMLDAMDKSEISLEKLLASV